MKASDDLFQLVKSLSPGEKRYFKKLHSGFGRQEKVYLVLFDALLKQQEYDEEVIKKEFADNADGSAFRVLKHSLFQQILKSLESYYAEKDIHHRLSGILNRARILHDKSFYKQAVKLLRKAKKEAWKYEQYPALLEITGLEKKACFVLMDIASLESIQLEEQEVIERNKGVLEFQSLSLKITTWFATNGHVRAQEQLKQFRKFLEDPRFQADEPDFSFKAKVIYLQIWAKFHIQSGEYKKGYELSRRLYDFMEGNEEILDAYLFDYLATLNNLFVTAYYNDRMDDAMEAFGRLEAIPSRFKLKATGDENIFIWTFKIGFSFQTLYYLAKGDFEKGLELEPEIQAGLKKYDKSLHLKDKLLLYFHLAYLHFGNGDYASALKWSNIIRQIPRSQVRDDYLVFTSLLDMIIHYELKNFDIAESRAIALIRFLKGKAHLYKFEKLFLTFMKRTSVHMDEKSIIEEIKRLQEDLLQLSDDPIEMRPLKFFDFVAWTESRIEKISFSEAIQRRRINKS